MQIQCKINLAQRRIQKDRDQAIFVAPGENGFSFFQVKLFTGSVSVLLTSISLKILKKILFLTVAFSVCREMLNAI